MDPFIGQLLLVPYNYAPKGWEICDGRLLLVKENAHLFALLGTTYGGDGTKTFALPDLRGRVAVGAGQAPDLQNYKLGEKNGQESVTLHVAQMPPHTHLVRGSEEATSATPVGNVPGTDTLTNIYGSTPSAGMHPGMLSHTGSGEPHENRQPFIALNYIIATEGVYPSRP